MGLRNRRRGIRLPGIIGGPIAVVIGLGIGYFGWNMRTATQEFVDASESADGVVVQLDTVRNSDDDILYHPVVEFTTTAGEVVEYRSATGSNPPGLDVGEQVEVYYDPDLPTNAKINSFVDLWMFSTIMLIFGGLFTFVGVISFFRSLLTILGIGGLLGIGAWLALRKKKDEDVS